MEQYYRVVTYNYPDSFVIQAITGIGDPGGGF